MAALLNVMVLISIFHNIAVTFRFIFFLKQWQM